MSFLDHDREELFEHYSHRVDHDNLIVVELATTLLVEEDSPEQSEFVQAFADGMMSLLIDLREKFPREKFDYYGVHFEEWLGDQPAQEPYLMSKEDLPEHTATIITEAADPVEAEEWLDFILEEQREEDEEFSREKSDPCDCSEQMADALEEQLKINDALLKAEGCDDPFDLEDTLFMKPVLRVNEGVAPHVITRKHYPFAHCVSCNKKNTDYCRLVCEDESKIEEFSHEK